jgi:hypothetical protein
VAVRITRRTTRGSEIDVTSELFESAVRGKGDLAGVFEYDGEIAYFYLYDASDDNAQKIIDSIRLFSGSTDLEDADVEVRWDDAGRRVGLFLRGVQWAVFNTSTGAKFGGNFGIGARPDIPEEEVIGPC